MDKRKWTHDDMEFLRANYGTMSTKELAEKLGISESSINNKLRRLKLKRNIHWTQEKILEEVRALKAAGSSLLSMDVQKEHNQLYSAACRHFGNWSSAVDAAGFSYEEIRRSV
jgi:transposase